jgi:hypothetical protein
VQIALSDVAARLKYPGQVTDVRVLRTGPSGRAVEIALEGTGGRQVVTGIAFDRALGLRSTLFTLQVGTSDSPPPPPPEDEGGFLQALPDDVSTLAPIAAPVASPSGFDQRVPTLPEAPPLAVEPVSAGSADRPWLAGTIGLLSALLAAAWAVARRAGLSGWAVRF